MIKSVVLKNFRGFKDHTIDFTPFCLLIGQNNAGKTTLIEALRIASAAVKKSSSAVFEMAPDYLISDIAGPVFRFSVETLDIEHRGIHYNYESLEPAIIKVQYNNNCSVIIAIGSDPSEIYCQMSLPGGQKDKYEVTSLTQKVYKYICYAARRRALIGRNSARQKVPEKTHQWLSIISPYSKPNV